MREAMPISDEMTIDERRKYVKLMASRYQKAKRNERSQLLTEMEQVSKLHRKRLIRLLNGESLERQKRQTPRSRPYGLEVEEVILRVWESLDYICAERLTPTLVKTATHLATFGALVLTAEEKATWRGSAWQRWSACCASIAHAKRGCRVQDHAE